MASSLLSLTPEARSSLVENALAAADWLGENASSGGGGFYVPPGPSAPLLALAGGVLRPTDWLVPGPREWPSLLGKGVSPLRLFLQVLGRDGDPQLGHASPLHLGDPELRILPCGGGVGARLTQAYGLGHAMAIGGEKAAALCLLGEGTVAESDFHVGLNLAAVFRAHTVFLVHAAPGRGEEIAGKALAYGLESGWTSSESSPEEALLLLESALERARAGGGPSLLAWEIPPVVSSSLREPSLALLARREMRRAWEEAQAAPPPPLSTLEQGVMCP